MAGAALAWPSYRRGGDDDERRGGCGQRCEEMLMGELGPLAESVGDDDDGGEEARRLLFARCVHVAHRFRHVRAVTNFCYGC